MKKKSTSGDTNLKL